MPDSMMFDEEEMYVVLETDQPEVFLTPEELLIKLKSHLENIQDALPVDLRNIQDIDEQARRLLDTSCDLDLGPDQFMQWYVVRLDK